MKVSDESIFTSAFRSFFKAIFWMIGLAIGLIPFAIILSVLFSSDTNDLQTSTKREMVPNADGTRKALSSDGPVILKLNITGVIGEPSLNQDTVQKILQDSREGDFKGGRVKALLLYINSPGGTVFDSDAIYRAVNEYKARYKVPVYAYVDGLCASGGLYIASAADKLYASNSSIIGSVGVILQPFFNFSETMERYGVKAKTITAGKGKDMMNPTRPWVEGEDKNFVAITGALYDRFVNIVTASRKNLNKEKLINEYGAGVFVADHALERGYIDGIEESFSAMLQQIVTEANLDANTYQVVELQKKLWFQDLFGSEELTALAPARLMKQLSSGSHADSSRHFQYLYHPSFQMVQLPQ